VKSQKSALDGTFLGQGHLLATGALGTSERFT
jgi:hypothetical protein